MVDCVVVIPSEPDKKKIGIFFVPEEPYCEIYNPTVDLIVGSFIVLIEESHKISL